jgi:hypothetical protein
VGLAEIDLVGGREAAPEYRFLEVELVQAGEALRFLGGGVALGRRGHKADSQEAVETQRRGGRRPKPKRIRDQEALEDVRARGLSGPAVVR